MRGGGFMNSTRGTGRGGLTRSDKTNSQPTSNNENDRGASNRNRFPPSSSSMKKDHHGRSGNSSGSSWSHFQNRGNADKQNVDSSSMDSWDPLRDDFKNNKFVDQNNRRQGGNSDPSLHISYIPVEIDEDGLRNLFVDKLPQFKPTRVIVAPLKDGRRHKFGFVHYQTLDQCQEAIRVMSGYRLGNLNLRVVLGKKTLNIDNSKNMRGPGDNIRNKGAETWSPLKGSNTYSPNKGSDSWGSNQRPPPGPGGSVPSASQGASSAGAFSSRTDIVNGNQTPSEPAEEGTFCAMCGKPATNACSACMGAIYYCGSTCQMADWPQHQLVCLGREENKPAPQEEVVDSSEQIASPRKPVELLKMTSLPKVTIPDKCECLWVSGHSPLNFHVQLTDNKEIIENITETLYSVCPDTPYEPDFNPQPGDVISALYSDENWYRAEVMQNGLERIKVRLFDYGNEEEVGRSDVKPLSHLLNVMPQAIPCRLHDVRVPNEHTEAVMKFFATHLQESGAELKLTKVDEVDGVFRVNLTLITGEDLADLLCANGHASRVSAPKESPYSNIDDARDGIVLDKMYPANVSYITNVHEMYVNLLSNCSLLREITDSLQTLIAENSGTGGNFVVNDAVVAQFEGMPGRGVVSALVSNKMLKVKFVDFGNIELYSMSDLRKMSDEFLRFPQLAVKCRLDIDKEELKATPESIVQYLKEEFPDIKEVRCKFLRKEGDTYVIQLIDKDDGSDEINKLRAAGLIRSKAGAPPLLSGPPSLSGPPLLTSVSNKRKVVYFKPSSVPLEVGATFSTAICNIDNPTSIHANFLTPTQEEAVDFLAEVQKGGEGKETFALSGSTPELDQLVLCFSESYQEWFRARVKSVGVPTCRVYALDYGLEQDASLDILVPAEEKFNSVPSLAYHVTFQGANQILSKLRDSVKKEDWKPVLDKLLIQESFQSTIISQDSLDVVIKPTFDFVGKLKELIKPIVEKRKSGSESAASTPPPAARSTPSPAAALPGLTSNSAAAVNRLPVRRTGLPQYVQITLQEWETVLLTLERHKRAFRELGVDM